MFEFPKKAEFNRPLPKAKIYTFAKPSRSVRDRFVSEIQAIVWKYKLSPETTNLPARHGVEEIQVFELVLKRPESCGDLLRVIDRSLAFPTFFLLTHGKRFRTVAAYKRPSEADPAKWVTDGYFETPWQALDAPPVALPIALDLAALYEGMLRQLIPQPPLPGESLRAQVERIARIQTKENERRLLGSRLAKERQFNRKVGLNQQLRALNTEIAGLASNDASTQDSPGSSS